MKLRLKNIPVLIILVGLSLALCSPRLSGPIDLRYDAGVYYILGTSLAEGKGYRLLSEPGQIEAIQYPPLLPALVTLHQWGLRTSDPVVVGRALRWSFLFIFCAYIAAVYAWVARYLSPGYGLLAALACLASPRAHFMSDMLFAEIPYALATALFFLAAGSPRLRDRPLWAFVPAAAAYLLRTTGIALLAAWVAESLVRRQFRQAALRGALALVPVLAWQWHVARVQSGPEYARPAYAYQRAGYQFYNVSYAEQLAYIDMFAPELGRAATADLVRRMASNLAAIPMQLGEPVVLERWTAEEAAQRAGRKLLGGTVPAWLIALPLALFSGLILAGALRLLIDKEWLVPLYLAFYLVLVCATPWPGQFLRYLVPTAPVLALCLCRALAAWQGFTRRRWAEKGRLVGAAPLALTAAVILFQGWYGAFQWSRYYREAVYYDAQGSPHAYRLFFYDPPWRAFDTSLEWLKRHARPGEVVASVAPHWVYLKTGLKAVMPPYEADVAVAQKLLDGVPVRYVIVDSLEFLDISRRYADPVVQAHPERWTPAYVAPDRRVRIYQRVHAP